MNFLTKSFNTNKKGHLDTEIRNKIFNNNEVKFNSEEHLKSSKFRMLNELLYTNSSTYVDKYFKKNKKDFEIYHEGFSNQANKWPTNPNHLLSKELNKKKYKGMKILDLGCGEAFIQQNLKNKVDITSYDLIALNQYVKECDIKNLPHESNTIDICIFCLSLMGTNFLEFLLEAKRVLKNKGRLIVAEITSRIKNEDFFLNAFTDLGFTLSNKKDLEGYFNIYVFS